MTQVEQAGRRAASQKPVRAAVRVGYFAKGAVYGVIGALALALALGEGGRTTDTKGAIATIASAPAGRVLVTLLAVGLGALALWRLLDAALNLTGTSGKSRWKAIGARLGRAGSGLAYGSVAFAAVRVALLQQPAGRGSDEAAQSWTARALTMPGGRAVVLAGAAVALVLAGRQLWVAVKHRFEKHLELGGMSARLRAWERRLGTFGFATRGLVFGLVGTFLVKAGLDRQPREAAGLDGTLEAIARQPYGMALLALTALGLLAYGAFAVIEGMHRRLYR